MLKSHKHLVEKPICFSSIMKKICHLVGSKNKNMCQYIPHSWPLYHHLYSFQLRYERTTSSCQFFWAIKSKKTFFWNLLEQYPFCRTLDVAVLVEHLFLICNQGTNTGNRCRNFCMHLSSIKLIQFMINWLYVHQVIMHSSCEFVLQR